MTYPSLDPAASAPPPAFNPAAVDAPVLTEQQINFLWQVYRNNKEELNQLNYSTALSASSFTWGYLGVLALPVAVLALSGLMRDRGLHSFATRTAFASALGGSTLGIAYPVAVCATSDTVYRRHSELTRQNAKILNSLLPTT